MSVHQLLIGAAQANPGGVAIRHQARTATWTQFAQRVARRATQLRALGLQPGARVALLAANVPEHMEAGFAILWAGLVPVPINTRLSLAEQQFILEHSACSLLCFDERHTARAAALREQLPLCPIQSLTPFTVWGTDDDPLRGYTPQSFTPALPTQSAAIFYTGGTTGRPKGVELSHVALLLQGLAAKDNYRLNLDTVFAHTAPMFHLADYVAALGATASAGSHTFLPEFSAKAVLDTVEHEGTNVAILIPTMIPPVLDAASTRPGVLPRLQKVLYGAAPIQEPVLDRLMREAPEIELFQVYGQTELGGACTILPPDRHVFQGELAGKLGSAGRVMPAFALRITDASGQPCANGRTGEIQVSGPGLMTSYWNDPEQTARAITDGWLRTGDLGVMDDEGFVSIVGRLKDMIVSGGENVFAGEVESALMYHDAVDSCAVFGVPDEKWGETVHAVVVLKKNSQASVDDLIAHCRARIAHYKCPREISIRHDPLPLSGVGKVRKVDLLAEWKHQHQQKGRV